MSSYHAISDKPPEKKKCVAADKVKLIAISVAIVSRRNQISIFIMKTCR